MIYTLIKRNVENVFVNNVFYFNMVVVVVVVVVNNNMEMDQGRRLMLFFQNMVIDLHERVYQHPNSIYQGALLQLHLMWLMYYV